METGPAPLDRPRMDMATFTENFSPQMLKETHLCYEWDVPEGDSRIPVDQMKGFLRNKGADTPGEARHAELCFLDLIPSWGLDKNEHYSVTLFISWSPCPDCARSLVAFLRENGHLSLRIFAARIYSKNWGYEDGLRQLQAAGAEVSIMSIDEYQHCWEAFVDHQGGPFQPHPKLHKHIQGESQRLEGILRARSPPCSPPAPLPPHLLSLVSYFPLLRPPLCHLLPPGTPAPSLPSLLTRPLCSPTSVCPSVLPHPWRAPTSSLFLFPPATLPTPFNLHLRPDSGEPKMDSTSLNESVVF